MDDEEDEFIIIPSDRMLCADVSHCIADAIYWARRHCSWQPSNPIQGPSIFRKRADLYPPLEVRFPIEWVISRRWSKYICYAIDGLEPCKLTTQFEELLQFLVFYCVVYERRKRKTLKAKVKVEYKLLS